MESCSFIPGTVSCAHNSRMDNWWRLDSRVRLSWKRPIFLPFNFTSSQTRLWWLGLYESVEPPILPWLFARDYSHAFVRWTLKAINGGQCVSSSAPNFLGLTAISALLGLFLTSGCISFVMTAVIEIMIGNDLHMGVTYSDATSLEAIASWTLEAISLLTLKASIGGSVFHPVPLNSRV